MGWAALELLAHHVDPFGVADSGGLGDHCHIPFTLLLHQAHPEPTADLAGEGGNDAQGRFTGIDQGIPAGDGVAGVALQQGIPHLQSVCRQTPDELGDLFGADGGRTQG